jgi:hypothetical protein
VRSGSDNVIDITLLGFTVSANFHELFEVLAASNNCLRIACKKP